MSEIELLKEQNKILEQELAKLMELERVLRKEIEILHEKSANQRETIRLMLL